MAFNHITPYFEPGDRITGHVAAGTVTAGTFVDVYGGRQAGGSPGLAADGDDSDNGGNYRISTASAGTRAFGVAEFDGALNAKVTVISSPGTVVPVLAGAAITAIANRLPEVEVDAAGKVIPLNTGKAVGKAMAPASNGAYAEIKLY